VRVFTFASERSRNRSGVTGERVLRVLERVAADTDTADLVVALYLLPGVQASRGTAYVRRWMTRDGFATGRGHWRPTLRFGTPDGVPGRFKLIRMRLDPDPETYPRDERDGYRWLFRYGSFDDHLAALFAHELHHFRRHHLGHHPRGGEHAANRWALETAVRLGFSVEGVPGRPLRRSRTPLSALLTGWRRKTDRYGGLRQLKAGDRIRVDRDPRNRYTGASAEVVRPARSNAKRMVIRTQDGIVWRWPLAWMSVFDSGETLPLFGEAGVE
jgi:hypothetical protein